MSQPKSEDLNYRVAQRVRVLDWAFSFINLFAIFILVWWLIPALAQLSAENRNYHKARIEDQKQWHDEVLKWMEDKNTEMIKELASINLAMENQATEQRAKTYGKLEEIVRSLNVDRKREHDAQREEHAKMLQLLGELRAGGKK